MSQGQPLPFASVRLEGTRIGVAANAEGMYRIDDVSAGAWTVVASMVGFVSLERRVEMQGTASPSWTLSSRASEAIEEVVISGTMKEVSKLASPVPVEVTPQPTSKPTRRRPCTTRWNASMACDPR